MSDLPSIDGPTLADVDADGAIADAFDALGAPTTRSRLFRTVLIGGGLAIAELAAPFGSRASSVAGDIAILRFDLTLEYLQAAMYTEAERLQELRGRTAEWVHVVGAHERAHVRILKKLLGTHAVASPRFDFRGVTEDIHRFTRTAVAFEDLTAALLKWQAPRLKQKEILAAALRLHSVEARHAAWIRHVEGIQPALTAFDRPASQQRMERLIQSTRFIAAASRTTAKRRPRYTG